MREKMLKGLLPGVAENISFQYFKAGAFTNIRTSQYQLMRLWRAVGRRRRKFILWIH